MSAEPLSPTSSAAYQWNSTVRLGTKPVATSARNVSRTRTEPDALSSAPDPKNWYYQTNKFPKKFLKKSTVGIELVPQVFQDFVRPGFLRP
jgi:hypothetical protein